LWSSNIVDDGFLRALANHSYLVELDITDTHLKWRPELLQFLPASLTGTFPVLPLLLTFFYKELSSRQISMYLHI
jgi:hypothetical protein